ncbi:hypothetical protein WN093_09230 [Gammaproteobacteria bacterium AS21]|jgi:hypothetical protein
MINKIEGVYTNKYRFQKMLFKLRAIISEIAGNVLRLLGREG